MHVAFAIIVTACSSQRDTSQIATLESGTTGSSNANPEIDDPLAEAEEAMLAFAHCLGDQGIEVGDQTVGADGPLQLSPIEFAVESEGTGAEQPDFSAFEDMMAPCQELLSGITGVGSVADASEVGDAMVEYTQCMRENGVEMPDPGFSSDEGRVHFGEMIGDEFEAADAICRSVFDSFSIGG